MKRISLLLIAASFWLQSPSLSAQGCQTDTIVSDIIFVIDNSGSISDAEYASFENLIVTSINKTKSKCQAAKIAVVHYGGSSGSLTSIEYPLSNTNNITNVNRQYCSQRINGICIGGGGDDLNEAMGDIIGYLNSGALDHDPLNDLSLVILTDAFSFEETCSNPNCSVIRPFTNIDILKGTFGASVTVVGMSSQAEASLLGIYASPGGNYAATSLYAPDCPSSYDGCIMPRKYIPLEFNSPLGPSSDSIVSCIQCKVQIVTPLQISLSANTSICTDRGESASIAVNVNNGLAPFTYAWSNGVSTSSQIVQPNANTTYTITVTDANSCVQTGQVTVTALTCGPDCDPDTLLSDVLFVIDNSQSIDDAEFNQFEDILLATINNTRASCPRAQIAVVHYGGRFGKESIIEYDFSNSQNVQAINRQFCSVRNQNNLCLGGGGDDLNAAMGNIAGYFQNGTLNRNPNNKLFMVIFTDAFGIEACDTTVTNNPNCSATLPFTNIEIIKNTYGAQVTVVGMSSQAQPAVLASYASPGGSYDATTLYQDCQGTVDGCVLPRKYIPALFSTVPAIVAAQVAECVQCSAIAAPSIAVNAGADRMICQNFGETATLIATPEIGIAPYTYSWNNGLGNGQIKTVSPAVTTTYIVTMTDANTCTAVDTVVVISKQCDDCFANAGTPQLHEDVCLADNGSVSLPIARNTGIVKPAGYTEVYVLTDENLTIVDYKTTTTPFVVRSEGLYRIHTLIAVTTNRNSPDYFDLSIIQRNISNLFVIVNCIEDHGVCADFDFPGRVFQVFGPADMMCMRFENSIALCSDGIDNDRDGLLDCRDPDCKGLENCQETSLIACNDLYDNDQDGLVDCDDPDCQAYVRCYEREEKCDDGIDNDGDGLIDCADSSCKDSGSCMETSAFTCIDGIDNDGDGLIDCQEESCKRFIVCAEYSVAACTDGKDNDYDGLIDCADSGCREVYSQICNRDENTAAFCNDGKDNDGDGLIDCADPQCASFSPCSTSNTGFAVGIDLNVTLLLQGAVTSPNENMSTVLNQQGYLPGQEAKTFFGSSTPAGQPYAGAPWFYNGDEGKQLKKKNKNKEVYEYPSSVVDWVLISLRTSPDRESEVWKSAALLHNDGSIELLKKIDPQDITDNSLYIVIEHRNHLPVMSAHKVKINNGVLAYDFTKEDSFTSILGIGQINMNGVWVMAAGNGELVTELSSDIDINVRDLTTWLQNNGANSSYFLEDYDMNGDVNIKDRILWEKNNGVFSSLRTK
jgi:hypothetical protein